VENALSFQDVFAFGIGLDIAGGYLIAKGLLLPTRQILNLSTPLLGWSPLVVIARVEDKVSTEIGVAALGLGFAFQLTGYFFGALLGDYPEPSPLRAFALVGLSLLGILLVLGAHRVWLPTRRRSLLIDIARFDNGGQKHDYPYGTSLERLGVEMPGKELGESQDSYAKRVWHVNRIIQGEAPGG